jgi:hypothetical protein
MQISHLAARLLAAYEPKDIKPDYSAPWNEGLVDNIQKIAGTSLIVLVIALIVACVVYGCSKAVKSSKLEQVSSVSIITILVMATFIGGAGSAIQYFSHVPLFG